MSKGIDLAKKLLAIKNSTTSESEAQKVDNLLAGLLKKYGISMSDIESDTEQRYLFTITQQFPKLFWQCVAHTLGMKGQYSKTSKPNKFYVYCTESQAIEIKEKYQHYISLYKKEVEFFQSAFIQKHKIVPFDGGSNGNTLTPEEAMKYASLMNGMDESNLTKALK